MNTIPLVPEAQGALHGQCCAHGTSKDVIVNYLKAGSPLARTSSGASHSGSQEYIGYSDGHYFWTGELIEFVEKYDLALPGEVVDHILGANRL